MINKRAKAYIRRGTYTAIGLATLLLCLPLIPVLDTTALVILASILALALIVDIALIAAVKRAAKIVPAIENTYLNSGTSARWFTYDELKALLWASNCGYDIVTDNLKPWILALDWQCPNLQDLLSTNTAEAGQKRIAVNTQRLLFRIGKSYEFSASDQDKALLRIILMHAERGWLKRFLIHNTSFRHLIPSVCENNSGLIKRTEYLDFLLNDATRIRIEEASFALRANQGFINANRNNSADALAFLLKCAPPDNNAHTKAIVHVLKLAGKVGLDRLLTKSEWKAYINMNATVLGQAIMQPDTLRYSENLNYINIYNPIRDYFLALCLTDQATKIGFQQLEVYLQYASYFKDSNTLLRLVEKLPSDPSDIDKGNIVRMFMERRKIYDNQADIERLHRHLFPDEDTTSITVHYRTAMLMSGEYQHEEHNLMWVATKECNLQAINTLYCMGLRPDDSCQHPFYILTEGEADYHRSYPKVSQPWLTTAKQCGFLEAEILNALYTSDTWHSFNHRKFISLGACPKIADVVLEAEAMHGLIDTPFNMGRVYISVILRNYLGRIEDSLCYIVQARSDHGNPACVMDQDFKDSSYCSAQKRRDLVSQLQNRVSVGFKYGTPFSLFDFYQQGYWDSQWIHPSLRQWLVTEIAKHRTAKQLADSLIKIQTKNPAKAKTIMLHMMERGVNLSEDAYNLLNQELQAIYDQYNLIATCQHFYNERDNIINHAAEGAPDKAHPSYQDARLVCLPKKVSQHIYRYLAPRAYAEVAQCLRAINPVASQTLTAGAGAGSGSPPTRGLQTGGAGARAAYGATASGSLPAKAGTTRGLQVGSAGVAVAAGSGEGIGAGAGAGGYFSAA